MLGVLAMAGLGGCTGMRSTNPDYPASAAVIQGELERMASQPATLQRPLVVIAGWRAPSWSSRLMAHRIRRVTGAQRDEVLPLAFPLALDLNAVAAAVVKRVEERWPSEDPDRTIEVDVVGISMGGLVARLAALTPQERGEGAEGEKRLRIARLVTLGTPHRGAKLAPLVPLDPCAKCMRAGSAFLNNLNARFDGAEYELVPYARLNDRWVGATNAAPPGREPIWVPGPPVMSHQTITGDRRILADLARRLRGEAPLAARGSHPPTD